MKRVVGLLFALTCANAQTTLKSGTNMGMAIAVIEQGKDAYFDSITKLINNVPLPDVYSPDGKGYMLENSFELNERTSDVMFTTDVAKNAVVLTCN